MFKVIMFCFTWNLPPEQDEQYVYIAGRDAGYSAGLSKRLRVDSLQFLAALCRDGLQALIIEAPSDADILESLHFIGNFPFSSYITAVFHPYLCSLDDFFLSFSNPVDYCSKFRQMLSQAYHAKLRASDKIYQFASFLQRG